MTNAVACKCPNCGAAISVQAVNGVMKCDYCQSAIQVAADKEGSVSLSTKHINVQGGTVQIADSLTVVQGNAAVTCSFCGRHNLKHNTFRCRRCKADDLCVEHQSSSGICKWCREEELAEASRRRKAGIAAENRRRTEEEAAASRRRIKVVLIVLGSIFGATFFLCAVVPAIIWLFSAIAQIPLTAWVIIFAGLMAIGVIAGAVWFLRNVQLGEESSNELTESDGIHRHCREDEEAE